MVNGRSDLFMEKRFLAPAAIADAMIGVGKGKCSLKTSQMLLLGIFAGAFIAFGAFASGMVSHSVENVGLSKFAGAAVFPVGLMLVVMCGAELFTGNNLITVAYLNKDVTLNQMLKNWVLVYIGNFIGSLFIAFMIIGTGLLTTSGGALGATAIKVASAKVSMTFAQAVIRGILCNILVVLAVWMAIGAQDFISKIWSCWFPIMLFVLCGFEHSIANMYFIPVGIMAKANAQFAEVSGLAADKLAAINWGTFFTNNIIPVTLGNIIGGAVIVGGIYWYVYKGCKKEEKAAA
jgi:formate/nitrite transporter